MNKKNLLMLCLPLLANADDPLLKKELNGLAIDTQLSAVASQGGSMPAPMTGEGTQVLKITNHSKMDVKCKVDPPPSSATGAASQMATLAPGQSVSWRLESYASPSQSNDSKLVCVPAHTSQKKE